jgi:hypothetical protein
MGIFDEGAMESKGNDFHVGSSVERFIEEMWFIGRIIAIDDVNQECSIAYADDDWEEENIPFCDIRLLNKDCSVAESKGGRKSSLPKPLLGLIDDDSEKRSAHQPTIQVHRDSNTGNT